MIFRHRVESSPLWTKDDDRVIRLSEVELWKIKRLAGFRNDPKMEKGVPNHKMCPRDDFDIHVEGLMAEYAVAIYFGEPMDVMMDLHGDNNGADLYVGPWSASVKYATHADPYLKFNNREEFRQDIGILAGPGPRENTVQLHGWTNQQHFFELQKVRDFGYGQRLYVEVKDLWPMRGLKALLFDLIAFPQIEVAAEMEGAK